MEVKLVFAFFCAFGTIHCIVAKAQVDNYVGQWIRQSDGRKIGCSLQSGTTVRCIFTGASRNNDEIYDINGAKITWTKNKNIFGTYNGKDMITWNSGNTWKKQKKSEEGFCKETFAKHTPADCILYDDEECDGDEGVQEMRRGGVLLTAKTVLPFDVESVSIRKGCQLTVYTGERLSGEYHIFTAVNDNLHITLDEDEELQKFDDNVNSAICSCMTPIFRRPVRYISTNKFPYYIPARFALRGSFVGEPVSVFTQHRFHSI